jgi:anti-anti-sigma regulatory factor
MKDTRHVTFQRGTQMAIKVRQDGSVYFVSGTLDIGSAEQFLHGMEPALDSSEEVLIDVSEVTLVDSFGLRSVALLARMVGDRGVLLRHPQDPVLKVLELLDVEAIPGVRIERW